MFCVIRFGHIVREICVLKAAGDVNRPILINLATVCGGSYRPVFAGYAILCVPAFFALQYLYNKNQK